MANSKQAKKRIVQAERNRQHNVARRSVMRTFLKKTTNAIEKGDVEAAKASFTKVVSLLDKYATKGLIHKNKAARHKSRLSAKIKALSAA
ncbi:30S ribosomal protein S20 [Candidatus Francisella endociliophora]|uniref:Small ribosomal subunit protein bS20 n=1 Tax=Candidatus Francisella endociliophora TaxID=653937 RepID=A0A097EQ36_9GAMM|nr:30S ribosomal protein S20 [Francisella sp. FSC1006]AIT09680.1 30S ribosomal protein S20 [Francisella sp. FSC1006]